MRSRLGSCLLLALIATGRAPVAAQTLRLAPYVSGLSQPVGLVADPSDTRRHFVVEKGGRLRVVESGVLLPDAALDLTTQIVSAGEQGLLGLAVDPAFATTGRIWVNFTRAPDGATVIARFTRAAGDPLRFDPASRLDLAFSSQPPQRAIPQPASNHNGGALLFDSAGVLIVPLGDGGGGNDAFRTAQDPQQLLGKILRLDVHVPDLATATPTERADAERGYRIPPDNPFVDGIPLAARPEIWAFGVRNPWRVSMDAPALDGTGALLIADVGQSAREEIDYEPAGDGGRNYGWPLREGSIANPSAPGGVAAAYLPLTNPVHDYPRSQGISVTGGHVYRGRLLGDAFAGRYVFGDFSNRLRSLRLTSTPGSAVADDVREHTGEVGGLSGGLVSIDADLQGELYLVLISGAILRLTTTVDADGDGVDDAWAATFGLAGVAPADRGPFGDPDGDGFTNAQEYRRGSHPLGSPVALFGEGAAGFFATRLGLMNVRDVAEPVALRFVRADGRVVSRDVVVPARRSLAVDAGAVPGLANQEFATAIEAARPMATARTMTWPATGAAYGSHSERGTPQPRTSWYFAEGATTAFELFLLLGNASGTAPAQVRVDYLRQGAPPLSRTYEVPASSRRTIWVNQEPGLDQTELGAVVTSLDGVPIVAERAMYTRGGAVTFAAGHEAAGEPAPATRWVFAEGSTSPYFETFLSVINPGTVPLPVTAAIRLQDGTTAGAPLHFTRTVPARGRATIWLDREVTDEGVALAGQDGISVDLTAATGFVAERAMWWPGSSAEWHEAHASAGFSEAPRAAWHLPGGEFHANPSGGDPFVQTYVLVTNVGAVTEAVEVAVFLTDREPVRVDVAIPPNSRQSLAVSDLLAGTDIGVLAPAHVAVAVAARSPAAQLYAEQATYGSTPTERWARGGASKGTAAP
ncbi:PQQ-dependent sugar dehydrogenase [Luteitalea sp.]